MINKKALESLHKIPLIWKLISLFFMVVGVVLVIAYLGVDFPLLVKDDFIIIPVTMEVFRKTILKLILIALFIIFLILGLLYWDIKFFISRINDSLRNSLQERHLEEDLSHFYKGKTFGQESFMIGASKK